MLRIVLLCTVMCYCFDVISQQTISGKVVDAASREPLGSANIAVGNQTTYTDDNGFFSLPVQEQMQDVTVTYVGYRSAILTAFASHHLLIELNRDAIQLKDVLLSYNSGNKNLTTLAKIDLNLQPVKNTQELMRLVPGLFIAQHAGAGKAEQIFFRGFDCDHGTDILVNMDGLPVNMVSHAHGQGYADAHFIIPETVNNIDYGAGPYYSQHGNLNTAGFINFSTHNRLPGSMFQTEAGRFDTYRTVLMLDLLKNSKDRQSAYVAGEAMYTNGPTVYPQRLNRFNLFGKYHLVFSPASTLTVSASGFKSKWDASGQIPGRAVQAGMISRFGAIDPTEGGQAERYQINLQTSTNLKNGAVWKSQAFYIKNIFSLYSNFTFFLNDTVNGDAIHQAENRNLVGINSSLSKKYFINTHTLTSTYGIGVRYDMISNSQLSHVVKRKFLNYSQLGDIQESNSFLFTDQQIIIGKWTLSTGLRFDYLNFAYKDKLNDAAMSHKGKAIISPKINIQYAASSTMQLYLKTGKGFHSNDSRVVLAKAGREILPAAYGADIGIILKPSNSLFFNFGAWYLYLDQEFVYVGDEGVVEASGKSNRVGVDVLARYQVGPSLFAKINLSITRPRFVDEPRGNNYIPLAPSFTSTGGMYYTKMSGFNGALSYRFIKDRPANDDNTISAKGYFLLDATASYRFKKFELGVVVENALNTTWNEAQFATKSRLYHETTAVEEIHFTPGVPFFAKAKIAFFF